MNCLIDIKKLTYKKDDIELLTNINLSIKEAETISIIGSPESGKTTLANMLFYNNTRDITYIKDYYEFTSKLVKDEIKKSLKKINKENELNNVLEQICKYLTIKTDDYIDKLRESKKIKLYIINKLINNSKIIIIDEIISLLDKETSKTIFEYLLKLNSTAKTTIINITNDTELLKYTNRIIVLNHGKIINDFANKDLIKNIKTLEQVGMNLPFLIDLSTRLNYYNILEKQFLDDLTL
jgi:ABC-type multidrug transport system ATPase subunit